MCVCVIWYQNLCFRLFFNNNNKDAIIIYIVGVFFWMWTRGKVYLIFIIIFFFSLYISCSKSLVSYICTSPFVVILFNFLRYVYTQHKNEENTEKQTNNMVYWKGVVGHICMRNNWGVNFFFIFLLI